MGPGRQSLKLQPKRELSLNLTVDRVDRTGAWSVKRNLVFTDDARRCAPDRREGRHRQMKTAFVRCAVGALAVVSIGAAVAASAPAIAKTNFDGTWSVVVVTEKGDCDRAYRYPIRINDDGSLINAGSTSFDISGKVSPNGKLVVRLSYGGKSATGQGRLSGASGTGQWAGGACAGTWTAERRS
jgi:hypothetical protein